MMRARGFQFYHSCRPMAPHPLDHGLFKWIDKLLLKLYTSAIKPLVNRHCHTFYKYKVFDVFELNGLCYFDTFF